ncbi:tyrosine-type recombinase/integrase [Homoserinimonas sp. OAct 916]|uniref:tyrosine-type recombinase/integrase n=1 Tax=Homoserinimonas sp. OAct 916 TaxID=2211450 RepID=UPI000DBE6D66|nr:tyrosine-type recombinase/integrase [Homoserinimonas sp. OAct 916]
MGSIHAYETASGKRYRALWRKPDHKQGQKRGFKTKRAAELHLAEVEVSKSRGEYIDAADARVTVGTLAVDWLNHQTQLKPSSYRPLESAWRHHVEPRWGKVMLSEIRHSDVQRWVSGIDRSATTVIRAHSVLASIIDVAVKDRRLLSNPARRVNLPRKVGKDRVYLSHEQVQLLADCAPRHSALILTLAYTGLRWGEATALRVSDLDMLRRRLAVRLNAVNVGGTIIVGTPKSHTSRSVPFPEFLTEQLAKLCEGKARDQLVFGDGVTHLRQPDSRRGWYVAAIRDATARDNDFPRLTLHDLRHTAASLAISAGANAKAVQRMLGHASAAMTLDTYADLFEDDLDAVATALNQAKSNSNVAKALPTGALRQAKTP